MFKADKITQQTARLYSLMYTSPTSVALENIVLDSYTRRYKDYFKVSYCLVSVESGGSRSWLVLTTRTGAHPAISAQAQDLNQFSVKRSNYGDETKPLFRRVNMLRILSQYLPEKS